MNHDKDCIVGYHYCCWGPLFIVHQSCLHHPLTMYHTRSIGFCCQCCSNILRGCDTMTSLSSFGYAYKSISSHCCIDFCIVRIIRFIFNVLHCLCENDASIEIMRKLRSITFPITSTSCGSTSKPVPKQSAINKATVCNTFKSFAEA